MISKLVAALILLTALGACNTVEGLGRDISAGARAVDNAI